MNRRGAAFAMGPRAAPNPGLLRRPIAGTVLCVAIAACSRAPQRSPAQAFHDGASLPDPRPKTRPPAEAKPPPSPTAPLHAYEEERRRGADFAHLPPSDRALGPDPIAIRALPATQPPRFVGLLRGRDALVLLDASLHEIARTHAPALPTGLAVADDGEIAVSGEQSPATAHYRVEGDAFRGVAAPAPRPGVYGLRDVALARGRGGVVEYAVDERDGTLFATSLDASGDRGGAGKTVHACAGAFRVARVGEELIVDCLLEHTLAIFDLDRDGMPGDAPRAAIRHDGPIWGFDAVTMGGALLIAAGGVEDHRLDRTEGSFGFIDSFVFLYVVPPPAQPSTSLPALPTPNPPAQPVQLASVNVSEVGVITPKALSLHVSPDGGATLIAAGYGSDRLAEITWARDLAAPPTVNTRPSVPGVASIAGASAGDLVVFADPLFDAWVPLGGDPVPVPDPGPHLRSLDSRVGEALFFTNLMAPWDRSEGRLSRFTCETCHFEGYVDGRTHSTGRGDIRATTKPLLGLFNNRPHFSRALDPDLATMVNNEFSVAGAKSGHDPWFTLAETKLPWVPLLGVGAPSVQSTYDALHLRRALMTFLMDFTPRPNPAVLGRTSFTPGERRGSEVFASHCERCHQARLSTDDAATRVPEARWEALVLSREGPIVWASTDYQKTGVEPYVHERGARPPSLRRLYKKWPYFTNGSAKSLRDAIGRVRWRGDELWHEGAPEGTQGLGESDAEALLAFLQLL